MCLEERGRAIGNLEMEEEFLPNATAWAEDIHGGAHGAE